MPFDPSYGNAPPNRDPLVFAQLCTETDAVELGKSIIINLYDNSTNIVPLSIGTRHFMSFFYPDGRNFSLNCGQPWYRRVAAGVVEKWDWGRLDNWVQASQLLSTAGEADAGLAQDLSGVQFELAPEVIAHWSKDLGVSADCWTPCSLMRIVSQLLKANYVCNLACDVCCSLCTYELAQALNSRANVGALNRGAQYDGRDASSPVKKGDKLALSLLFTNPNVGVRPIDVRLNFCIVGSFVKKKVILSSAAVVVAAAATKEPWVGESDQYVIDIAEKYAAENPEDIKNTWIAVDKAGGNLRYINLEEDRAAGADFTIQITASFSSGTFKNFVVMESV